MLFNFALITSFLLASAVLADRRREDRQSRFVNRVEQSAHATSDDVEYSDNWSGAVWGGDAGTFTSVTGTFAVPVPSGDSGSAASAWVGIDGDSCSGGLLQTGVDFVLTDNGPTYDAWYEWYPDWSYYFSDLEVSAGDVIRATVTSYSSTSGIATIENLTNGQSGSTELTSTYALCGQNAEWIVEDFEDGNGNLVPFADFGAVTFTDAVATGTGYYTSDGASVIDIEQNNQVLTSVSIDGSSLTVVYV